MWPFMFQIVNVLNGDFPNQQRIADQGSVTSPGDGFRAHNSDLRLVADLDHALERRGKPRRLHIVCVAPE